MSSNILFRVPGRNTNYMPIDLNASKDQILELYARQSFSTNPENTWPYASPLAGYYDIKNSDTKLILLNNNRRYSHLRGKTSAKRESVGKDKFYDWVEREFENKKLQEKEGAQKRIESSKVKRVADPDRHFTHIGCTYRPVDYDREYLNSPNKSYRNPSASSSIHSKYHMSKKNINVSLSKNKMTKEEEEELIAYLVSIGKRTTGLQDKGTLSRPPSEYRSSFNLNHPDLNRDQKLYLNNLCGVYSVRNLKESKTNRYMSILEKQKAIDKYRKERYKLHPSDDFASYKSFIRQPRPVPNLVNCGYMDPRKPSVKSAPAAVEKRKIYNHMYASESAIDYSHKNSRIRTPKDNQQGKVTPALLEKYIENKKESENTTNLSSSSSSSISLNQEVEKSTESFDLNKSSSNLSQSRTKSQSSRKSSARSDKSRTVSSASSSPQSKTSAEESLSKQDSKESVRSKGSSSSMSSRSSDNKKKATARSKSNDSSSSSPRNSSISRNSSKER